MSLDKLVEEGRVHPFKATPEEINKAVEIARRDLALAEKIYKEDLDWCFSITYNAVLQISRAYMFHLGYRSSSAEAHKTTFEFMQFVIDDPFKKYISYFDRVRKKRHRTLYDEAGLVTENDAKGLLRRARDYFSFVEDKLKNS